MLNWAYLPYTLPLILSGIAAVALSVYAAQHNKVRGARAFTWFCLAAAEWALAYALEIGSTDLPTKLFWVRVEYLGITFGPLFWLAFALHYARRVHLTPRLWTLLSLIPLTTLILAFTNEAHGLIWREISMTTDGPFPTLYLEYGGWFWVHTLSSYVWVLAGSVFLLRGQVEARQFYRRQRLALLVGILTPWIGNILYIAKLSPVPGLDLTPFTTTVTAVAVALALFSFRLLDLVPVARRAMLDSMGDAVIALDTQDRILDLNRAASQITGVTQSAAIGRPARQVFGKHFDLLEHFGDVREAHTEVVLQYPPEVSSQLATDDSSPSAPRRTTEKNSHLSILNEGNKDKRRVTRDGYFEVQIAPLRDVVGEYSGRMITLHDITERKRAQEEIQALNADLEARVLARTVELAAANEAKEETLRREQSARQDLAFLAEASRILAGSLDEGTTLTTLVHHIVPYLADGCAIHVADETGQLQRRAAKHVDPAQARLVANVEQRYPTGYQAPYGFSQVTRSGEPYFYPDVKDDDLQHIARDEEHLALLRALNISSYICVPLVGRERTLGAITLLRCDPDRQYTPASLALAIDLAQRTALAVENAQLYLTAQRAVQVRDEFLTVASHELKTPLTTLLLAVHRLLKSTRQGIVPSAEYLDRRLHMLDDQSKRLSQLVNNLLDISRITGGRLELEPQIVDLSTLVRQTVEQLGDALAEARCPVTLKADLPVRGNWDPARIEQVVANLLTNAMKYGRGRPVSITVTRDGSSAQVVVADEGIGIAPEHIERVFGPFERGVAPGKYSGMGMGLYIARQIVEAHGGSIGVTSSPAKGATFTVVLPGVSDSRFVPATVLKPKRTERHGDVQPPPLDEAPKDSSLHFYGPPPPNL